MEDREPYITGGKMREIKFRAWDIKNRKIISVYSVSWGIDHLNGLIKLSDPPHKRWSSEGEAEDVILMQYTGLKDTEGTPIYEGDIVYVAGVGNCVVSWDEDCAGWSFGNDDGQGDYQDVLVDLERIVGNIYEDDNKVDKGGK